MSASLDLMVHTEKSIASLGEVRFIADLPEVEITARDRSWVKARLDRGRRERSSEDVKVTPGIAALLMQCNLGNRAFKPAQFRLHVDRLMRGDFILHHHGIAISKSGVLNDGQHRLAAIIATGIPGMIQVTFGAEREEFHAIDQGKTRGAADLLEIRQQNNVALRASAAKFLYQIKTCKIKEIDPQIVADYAIELQGAQFDEAIRVGQSMAKVCAPTPATAAHYLIAQHTRRPTKIAAFWDGLPQGESLVGVRLRLREWLLNKETTRSFNLSLTCLRSAAIITAWNSFNTGKKTFNTNWRHNVKLPDVL